MHRVGTEPTASQAIKAILLAIEQTTHVVTHISFHMISPVACLKKNRSDEQLKTASERVCILMNILYHAEAIRFLRTPCVICTSVKWLAVLVHNLIFPGYRPSPSAPSEDSYAQPPPYPPPTQGTPYPSDPSHTHGPPYPPHPSQPGPHEAPLSPDHPQNRGMDPPSYEQVRRTRSSGLYPDLTQMGSGAGSQTATTLDPDEVRRRRLARLDKRQ